jgi:hypothetical protein
MCNRATVAGMNARFTWLNAWRCLSKTKTSQLSGLKPLQIQLIVKLGLLGLRPMLSKGL